MKKLIVSSFVVFTFCMLLSVQASAKIWTTEVDVQAGCCKAHITVVYNDAGGNGFINIKGSGCCNFDLSGDGTCLLEEVV